MDRDSRKISQLNLPTIGVSSAWWPRNLRRCIATGEAAQRRRALIMRGWGDSRHSLIPCHYLFLWLYLSGIFTILVGGISLGILVFGPWVTFLVLYSVWMLVAATVAIWFMIAGAQPAHHRQRASSRHAEKTLPRHTSHVELQYRQRASSRHAEKTLPRHISHVELQFPITPMPDASLVRVLETVDLSASGIEHFLDAAMTKSLFEIDRASSVEQELRQSHLAFPADARLPQSQLGATFDDETWRIDAE